MIAGSGTKWNIQDKKSKCSREAPLVVAFSGGRSSGLMLRIILDSGEKPVVLFANTGKERDETLDFVHEVETRWGVDVVWLEYTRVVTNAAHLAALKTKRMRDYACKQPMMHWFRVVNYETAARHTDENTPFDSLLEWMTCLPNPRSRACTAQLKQRTMQRYLWSIGLYEFRNAIGYRADEPDRAYDIIYSGDRDADVRFTFPLTNRGVTEPDVRAWWDVQEFDLALDSYEGNCHLCFLKKRAAKQRLLREQPHLAEWWENAESQKRLAGCKSGAKWRAEKGHSIPELMRDSVEDPEEMDDGPAMDCACTSALSLADKWSDDT